MDGGPSGGKRLCWMDHEVMNCYHDHRRSAMLELGISGEGKETDYYYCRAFLHSGGEGGGAGAGLQSPHNHEASAVYGHNVVRIILWMVVVIVCISSMVLVLFVLFVPTDTEMHFHCYEQ